MSILGQEKLTIQRDNGGTFIKGNYTPNAPTIFPSVFGNAQPAPSDKLQQLPEGDRDKDVRQYFGSFEIKKSDLVTVERTGVIYEVASVADWSIYKLGHFSGLLMRTDNQDATI